MNDTSQEIIESAERLSALEDVDEVVKNLARLLELTVRSRWLMLYVFDRDRHEFTPTASHGIPASYRKPLMSTSLTADRFPELKELIRKKQPLIIADPGMANVIPEPFGRFFRSLTLIAVPMVMHSQLMGIVLISRRRKEGPFLDSEAPVIKDIVAHAAVVVSHMRLFNDTLDMAIDLGRRADIILAIDDINRAISSSLSREKIIQTTLESIERIVRCDLVVVIEEEKGALEVKAAKRSGIDVISEFKSVKPIECCRAAETAFSEGKSCSISSSAEIETPGAFERALIAIGINSFIAIPLISQHAVKGVLLIGRTTPGTFTEEETFTIEKIGRQVAVALENARLYEDMRSLFFNTVASLANAIDAKSPWTKGHSQRVMHMAAKLARMLSLPDKLVERVRIGGLLHDVGKIGIIEALLEKPAALAEDEFPPMRQHPMIGVSILQPIEQLREVLPGILHHHEWYDGTGYPKGLKGEDIPLEARIISVADSFDAMVADRPYKKGLSVQEALAELRSCAGIQFDPKIVEVFASEIERKWAAAMGT